MKLTITERLQNNLKNNPELEKWLGRFETIMTTCCKVQECYIDYALSTNAIRMDIIFGNNIFMSVRYVFNDDCDDYIAFYIRARAYEECNYQTYKEFLFDIRETFNNL